MLTLIIQVLCFIKVIISLLKFPDISTLNSSNIESMISRFNRSEELNLIGDISK